MLGKQSKLIYGTAWKEHRTADLVEMAVLNGFRAIDTACQPKHYNEAGVGEALQRLYTKHGMKRNDLFVQTKFSPLEAHDGSRIPYDPNAPLGEQVKQSFAVSKKNLGTDYLDSLVIHSPLRDFTSLMQVWRAMEDIAKAGGALQLGISNCYDLSVLQRLYHESAVKPAVVQNRFYEDSGYDVEIRKFCQQNDIRYQSFWTLTANPHILESSIVLQIAGSRNRTPVQIFFRYLTMIGVDPLTGTKSESHMREDLDIFSFTLDLEEIKALKQVVQLKFELNNM